MRVFAISDLHVDYTQNRHWLDRISACPKDVLILAGDISDQLDRLKDALSCLTEKFARVFFVPGNHELWIRRGKCADSLEKFTRILDLCANLGIATRPQKIDTDVCIVPLFSWYEKEGPESLCVPKIGEDPTLQIWSDLHFTKWPPLNTSIAQHFLTLNEPISKRKETVISFSHFLPRQELIYQDGIIPDVIQPHPQDPHPTFNFSRVAGSKGLETQIRSLGSHIHFYGHQHRNRHRTIDDITYISFALGYRREQERGLTDPKRGPKQIWDTERPGHSTSWT